MADLKITQLDAVETPVDTDLLETVQDVATIPVNKKITWTTIKAFLKSYFDTLYAPIGGGGGLLKVVEVELEPADVFGIFSTPYEILPAVEDKLYVIVNAVVQKVYNSVQYTGGGNIYLSDGSQNISSTIIASALFNAASSFFRVVNANDTTKNRTTNTPISLTNESGAFADGNSNLKVLVSYYEVDTF